MAFWIFCRKSDRSGQQDCLQIYIEFHALCSHSSATTSFVRNHTSVNICLRRLEDALGKVSMPLERHRPPYDVIASRNGRLLQFGMCEGKLSGMLEGRDKSLAPYQQRGMLDYSEKRKERLRGRMRPRCLRAQSLLQGKTVTINCKGQLELQKIGPRANYLRCHSRIVNTDAARPVSGIRTRIAKLLGGQLQNVLIDFVGIDCRKFRLLRTW